MNFSYMNLSYVAKGNVKTSKNKEKGKVVVKYDSYFGQI